MSNFKYNWDDIGAATLLKIEEILNVFNIDFHAKGDTIVFPCPIHGSSKPESLSLCLSGHEKAGVWKCWTQHCEDDYGGGTIGLVRALLSLDKDIVSIHDTIKFLEKFIDGDVSIQKEVNKEDKRGFIATVDNTKTEVDPNTPKIVREQIRSKLSIPPEYYLCRGYSKNILDKYDVGLCVDASKKFYNRVVVPIYDEDYKYMIGCTARITSKSDKSAKWLHNGIKTSHCLYNYWFAKNAIARTQKVILVESPGNIWRLTEAGIENCVGLFGCQLSENQRIILEKSGALDIILMLDNDDAGMSGMQKIKEKMGRLFNIHIPKIDFGNINDIGEMSTDDINSLVKPLL